MKQRAKAKQRSDQGRNKMEGAAAGETAAPANSSNAHYLVSISTFVFVIALTDDGVM